MPSKIGFITGIRPKKFTHQVFYIGKYVQKGLLTSGNR